MKKSYVILITVAFFGPFGAIFHQARRKGGGADLKDLLMEGFQREGAALFLFIGVPEIFEGKIAHIVTEIVGRGFEKGLVEGLGRGLLKAEFT